KAGNGDRQEPRIGSRATVLNHADRGASHRTVVAGSDRASRLFLAGALGDQGDRRIQGARARVAAPLGRGFQVLASHEFFGPLIHQHQLPGAAFAPQPARPGIKRGSMTRCIGDFAERLGFVTVPMLDAIPALLARLAFVHCAVSPEPTWPERSVRYLTVQEPVLRGHDFAGTYLPIAPTRGLAYQSCSNPELTTLLTGPDLARRLPRGEHRRFGRDALVEREH